MAKKNHIHIIGNGNGLYHEPADGRKLVRADGS